MRVYVIVEAELEYSSGGIKVDVLPETHRAEKKARQSLLSNGYEEVTAGTFPFMKDAEDSCKFAKIVPVKVPPYLRSARLQFESLLASRGE